MKHFFSSFALSLGLLVPVLSPALVACSGADDLSIDRSSGSNGTSDDGAQSDDAEVGTVDSEVKSGKKKSCASVGGMCVGLSPSSCNGGHFADATQVSCGGGVGAACCIVCPALSAPGPGFCPGGTIVVRKNANGCDAGFDCIPSEPPPPPSSCPDLVQPPPPFCPGGKVVPVKNPSTGCITGFDCVPAPVNTCTAAGGTCVGLAPSSCAPGHWADASTHSCGGGVGVGCCLP